MIYACVEKPYILFLIYTLKTKIVRILPTFGKISLVLITDLKS